MLDILYTYPLSSVFYTIIRYTYLAQYELFDVTSVQRNQYLILVVIEIYLSQLPTLTCASYGLWQAYKHTSIHIIYYMSA